MSEDRIKKFESKIRLKELNPYETLGAIGLKENQVFCDIGAGTGIFSFAASGITTNKIYAVEIADEMLKILASRKEEGKVEQLEIIKVSDNNLPIESKSVDIVLLSTVFHELEEPSKMLEEIHRIKKDDGLLAVIEFHKKETPMGPPIDHRVSKKTLEEICRSHNFKLTNTTQLGENFYLSIFQ